MRARSSWIERLGFRAAYRLADLTYTVGVATPKRTVAGTYWSYEPTNPHGDDAGLRVLDATPTDAVILDVGAHVGEHAIPLAVGTDRRVVAVEPNGESADRLARNAARNDLEGRLDRRRIGVGNERDTRPFYRSSFSKCSAFDRAQATRWGARVTRVEQVPVYRLDDLVRGVGIEAGVDDGGHGGDPIPVPDALKIDVEGHELAVLRGASATIETHRPLVVVEVHGTEDAHARRVRGWLTERGYDVEAREDVWVCRG